MRKQRSSLLLTNVNGVKTVFFGSGSVLETNKGASGWIIAYDVRTDQIAATLAMSSRYFGAGIWMAGQGLSADSQGFIYGTTGNGGFDAVTDFGECVFKVQYTPGHTPASGKLEVVDWWSPYSDAGRIGKDPTFPTPDFNPTSAKLAGVSAPSEEAAHDPVNKMPDMSPDAAHNAPGAAVAPQMIMKPRAINTGAYSDQDLGSGGACLIEKFRAAIFAGKDGIAYVTNMDAMGKTQPKDFAAPAANYAKLKAPPVFFTYYPGPNVSPTPQNSSDLDFMFAGRTHHMHSTPVVYDSPGGTMIYCCGENGNVRAWRMDATGALTYLACSAEFASWVNPGMPGGFMALSANGLTAGSAILWVCLPQGDANKGIVKGNLLAYDALNFGKFQDNSGSLQLLWRSPDFTFNKFMPPVISGGRVYIATYDDQILCFGLN